MSSTDQKISIDKLQTVGQAEKFSTPRPSIWPRHVWFRIDVPVRTLDGRLYRAAQSNIVRDRRTEKLQW